MREKYESLSVAVLKDVAKTRGLKHLSGLKKSELVELMIKEDEKTAEDKSTQVSEDKRVPVSEEKKIQTAERPERKQTRIVTSDGI